MLGNQSIKQGGAHDVLVQEKSLIVKQKKAEMICINAIAIPIKPPFNQKGNSFQPIEENKIFKLINLSTPAE